MSLLLQIVLMITTRAHAQGCGFAQTIHGPFTFKQVELVSRVHSVGLWRGGDITLKPWIEVSENAYLGLDKDGRALNVIRLKDRTIAFVLSGERKIKDLFFRAPGTLLAIDADGEVLRYEQRAWAQSSVREIVAKSFRNYGITMCSAGGLLWFYSWLAQVPLVSPEIVGSLGLSSVSALLIEAFRASVRFERQNESTDGFRALGVKVDKFHRSEFLRGPDGEIADYDLGEGRSLQALLGTRTEQWDEANFDLTCEHELLPRGIPPEVYEPRL